MLLVRICNYLQSFLKFKCLVFGACHQGALYYVGKDVRIFFEAKRGPRGKKFGKRCSSSLLQHKLAKWALVYTKQGGRYRVEGCMTLG